MNAGDKVTIADNEYSAEGHFQNGDIWTGGREKDDDNGPDWFDAVDGKGFEYQTQEMPDRFPLCTLTQYSNSFSDDDLLEKMEKN